MQQGKLKNCIVTGELFLDQTGSDICPEALEEIASRDDYRPKLRELRDYCRDKEDDEELVSIKQAARDLDIDRVQVLAYIYRGDIDTYAFDDPKVRDFKLQQSRLQSPGGGSSSSSSGPGFGFHSRKDD